MIERFVIGPDLTPPEGGSLRGVVAEQAALERERCPVELCALGVTIKDTRDDLGRTVSNVEIRCPNRFRTECRNSCETVAMLVLYEMGAMDRGVPSPDDPEGPRL